MITVEIPVTMDLRGQELTKALKHINGVHGWDGVTVPTRALKDIHYALNRSHSVVMLVDVDDQGQWSNFRVKE